jgi:hypothetical protein
MMARHRAETGEVMSDADRAILAEQVAGLQALLRE